MAIRAIVEQLWEFHVRRKGCLVLRDLQASAIENVLITAGMKFNEGQQACGYLHVVAESLHQPHM